MHLVGYILEYTYCIVNMHNTSSETKQIGHLLRTSTIGMLHFKILNDQTVQVSKTLVWQAVRSVNTSPHKFQRSSYNDYILPASTMFVQSSNYSQFPQKWTLIQDAYFSKTITKNLRPYPPNSEVHNSHTALLITQKVKKVTDIRYSVTIFRMSFMKIIYLVFAIFTSVVESGDIQMNTSITFGRFIWNPTDTIKRISVTRLFMK